MDKKAQITIFIIIGILIVLLGVFVYIFTRTPEVQIEANVDGVRSFVEGCIQNRLERGIDLVSMQGGSIYPVDYIETEEGVVGLAYDSRDVFVSIEEIEVELSAFVTSTLGSCIQNFSLFEEQGLDIEEGEAFARARVLPQVVRVDVEYPLKIVDGGVVELNEFTVSKESRVAEAHTVIKSIVENTKEDWIDLAFLSSLGDVTVLPVSSTEQLYSVNYDDYSFVAGFRFSENLGPVIDAEERYQLVDGQLFTLDLDVSDPEGDSLECTDDTHLFDISSDCRIEFTPEVPGEYEVLITAKDSHRNSVSKTIVFEVA
ncbi:hypothetical protein KY330_01445 [Candidatus Woesearchaeota archaeon]|nr:hypothetical protein [Candidatus Woesearchaeota archaeon]